MYYFPWQNKDTFVYFIGYKCLYILITHEDPWNSTEKFLDFGLKDLWYFGTCTVPVGIYIYFVFYT